MNFKSFFKYFLESREVIGNIKNKNPAEIWKVAQDMRKNPGDYPDLEVDAIIRDRDNTAHKKTSDSKPLFSRSVKTIEHDGYILLKASSHYPIVKVKKQEVERVVKELDKEYGKIPDVSYKSNKFDQEYMEATRSIIGDLCREIEKLRDQKSKIETMIKMQKIVGKIDSDIESTRNNAVKAIEKKIKKLNVKYDSYHKLSNSDIVTIFKSHNITAPDIYHYLISNTFFKPKHPNEIPDSMKRLPEDVLFAIYYKGKTPQDFARDSARIANGSSDLVRSLKYRSNTFGIRVLKNEDLLNAPTSKESSLWMKNINDKIKDTIPEDKIPSKHMYFADVVFEEDVKHLNFPSFMMEKTLDGSPIETYNRYSVLENKDFSFDSWTVFRWFLFNINSKFLTTEKTVHGPAGQTNQFLPLSHLSSLRDVDLVNGLKTSPERVFRIVAERMADAHKGGSGNVEFQYPRSYVNTNNAIVLYNQAALDIEGERMGHCVSGYGSSCMNGGSLIVRLPKSTAELNPTNLSIYQHMGNGNTPPPQSDRKDLIEWIKVNSEKDSHSDKKSYNDYHSSNDHEIDLDFLDDNEDED